MKNVSIKPLLYFGGMALSSYGFLLGIELLDPLREVFFFEFGPLFAALLLGYFLGSVPFGLLLTKVAGLRDLRKIGSGNIGATNVLRTGNKPLAILTLAFDILKSAAAIYVVCKIYSFEFASLYGYTAGASAVLGHMFPCWLGFKGGKGVATLAGGLFMFSWVAGLLTLGTWLIVVVLTRYSSLGALVSAVLGPVYSYFTHESFLMFWFAGLSCLIFIKHRDNIKRLIRGEESKVGQ